MIQYHKYSTTDYTGWSYIDITLEAYDKLEQLLIESKEIYVVYPTMVQGKIIKCRLIVMALVYTLSNITDNIAANKLKRIYAWILAKLETLNINHIDILIRAIQILQNTIQQLKIAEGSPDNQKDVSDVKSFTIEV